MIEKKPGSALLLARLAQPLRAMGRSQEALDAMRKSVQADPNQPEDWYNLGLLESDLGDKKSAIEAFRKSIALDQPLCHLTSATARESLGMESWKQHQPSGVGAEADPEDRGSLLEMEN